MNEALQHFVGKECLVYTHGLGTTLTSVPTGIVKALDGNWLVLETGKDGEANTNMFNVAHIVRIREYPTNKLGQKKKIIAD